MYSLCTVKLCLRHDACNHRQRGLLAGPAYYIPAVPGCVALCSKMAPGMDEAFPKHFLVYGRGHYHGHHRPPYKVGKSNNPNDVHAARQWSIRARQMAGRHRSSCGRWSRAASLKNRTYHVIGTLSPRRITPAHSHCSTDTRHSRNSNCLQPQARLWQSVSPAIM